MCGRYSIEDRIEDNDSLGHRLDADHLLLKYFFHHTYDVWLIHQNQNTLDKTDQYSSSSVNKKSFLNLLVMTCKFQKNTPKFVSRCIQS